MTDDKEKATLRELLEHLKENPPPEPSERDLELAAEEAKRATGAMNAVKEQIGALGVAKKEIDALKAFQKQMAGLKPPDFSAMVDPAIRDSVGSGKAQKEALDLISESVARRRNQKDREDAVRTRALESLARDGIYTRIAAIGAAVAAFAGIVTVLLMAWSMIRN